MPFFSRFSAYFQEVVRQGSIRKAADRLNIAASAIDRQMLNAEEILGTPLFDRLPNGLRLTSSGELVIHCLRRWSDEHGKLQRQIEALKGARVGEVAIAVADGLAPEFMPTAIKRIQRSLPRMTFRVIVAVAETVAAMVRSGECEIGLTFDPVSFAGLSTEYSTASRLGILTPPGHPLASQAGVSQAGASQAGASQAGASQAGASQAGASQAGVRLSDCVAYPIVAPDQTTALWRLIDRVTSERRAPLDIVFTSNNVAMLCEMVSQGIGIGLMRDLDAMAHIRSGRLAFTPLIHPDLAAQKLSILVARGRRLPAATDLFIQHLKSLMHEMDVRGGAGSME